MYISNNRTIFIRILFAEDLREGLLNDIMSPQYFVQANSLYITRLKKTYKKGPTLV